MALDATKTAHEIITSGRSTGQTVIDSDGNMKWAMENIYSGEGATQAVTVVSGVAYTIRASSGSVAYSGAATGTLDASAGVARVEITASTTTLTITPTAATEIAVYRSDLGGMQFDKYGSDYLPNTTGAALYSLGVNYETGVGGMQVWEGRTNLNTYFEVTAGEWIDAAGAVLTDQSQSVLGVFRGCKVESDGNVACAARCPDTFEVTSGSEYAVSFLWSDSDTGELRIRVDETGVGTSTATITAAGVFTQTANPKGTVVLSRHIEVLAGLYRTDIVWTPDFTGAASFAAGPNSAVAGESVIFYGAMAQLGSSGGPWIPTFGSTQTRGSDNLSTLLSSFGYNVNEGTVVADFITAGSDGADFPRVWQWSTSVDNTTRVALMAIDTYNSVVVDNSVVQSALEMDAIVPFEPVSVASAFKTDDFSASQDGGAVVTDTSGTLPSSFTQILYGMAFSSGILNGEIRKLAYYPKRLSDATLVEASS